MPTDYGIDLGTARTIIYKGKSIVLNEPSVVAFDTHTGEPIAFGEEAFQMLGRTPDSINAVCPIERGFIADYEVAEHMVRKYLSEVSGNKMLKARVMVSKPSGITAVQQRSVIDACTNAGARDVCLIESPLAAALGNDINFNTPKGVIVVDIGKGTTDIAVLSMGGLAACESAKIASVDFDEAISRYVRKEYNILIGPHTAENIKLQIGSVWKRPVELALKAKGRNQFTGLPSIFEITSDEVMEALGDTALSICKAVQSVLEKTPPEMISDIANDGILLTGGGALIYGMTELLSDYTRLKVTLVPEPITCVVAGIGKALSDFDVLKNGDYRFRTLEDLAIE